MNAVGVAREQSVADAVQGTRSGEIIRTPAGSTDVDVTDAAGNLYAVGGPAKAKNLGLFVQSLTIYSQTAATRGVDAYFYYAEGTPQSVINAATKVLGSNFVKPELSDEITIGSIVLANEGASTLAKNGYDVVQNPSVPGPKNPDYLINGQIFDNYAPSTGNVRNIASTISDKVAVGQASNIVVNLADSDATVSAWQTQLNNYPVPGLKQVIVITKSGTVTPLTIKAH